MCRPPDLFGLLPLGEIAVAAARVNEASRVASHLEQAAALLGGLGHPVLWSAPHHWYGIQVAVVAERPDWLERHTRPLAAAARESHYAEVLTDAARVWLQVLGARVDPAAVERAARRLVGVGLAWDGARLVGHAAARTPDRTSMVGLLQIARSLKPSRDDAPAAAGGPSSATVGTTLLSGRELEVARLVVDGQTYRQIADRLYISPKTVEHHVARMRQRLDLHSRGELLAHLRSALQPQPMRRSGNGSSAANASACTAVTGPISTKRVRRRHQPGPAARHRPGGVRRERVRGLGEAQAAALGEEQERVEEAARQHDVVVDEQQPVGAVGRVRAQRGVEVRPLAGAGRAGADPQLDVVARALELPAQPRG